MRLCENFCTRNNCDTYCNLSVLSFIFHSTLTLRFIIQAFQFNGILFIGFNQTNISSKVNKLFNSLRVTTSHCHLKRSSAFYVADVYILHSILQQEIDYLIAIFVAETS